MKKGARSKPCPSPSSASSLPWFAERLPEARQVRAVPGERGSVGAPLTRHRRTCRGAGPGLTGEGFAPQACSPSPPLGARERTPNAEGSPSQQCPGPARSGSRREAPTSEAVAEGGVWAGGRVESSLGLPTTLLPWWGFKYQVKEVGSERGRRPLAAPVRWSPSSPAYTSVFRVFAGTGLLRPL